MPFHARLRTVRITPRLSRQQNLLIVDYYLTDGGSQEPELAATSCGTLTHCMATTCWQGQFALGDTPSTTDTDIGRLHLDSSKLSNDGGLDSSLFIPSKTPIDTARHQPNSLCCTPYGGLLFVHLAYQSIDFASCSPPSIWTAGLSFSAKCVRYCVWGALWRTTRGHSVLAFIPHPGSRDLVDVNSHDRARMVSCWRSHGPATRVRTAFRAHHNTPPSSTCALMANTPLSQINTSMVFRCSFEIARNAEFWPRSIFLRGAWNSRFHQIGQHTINNLKAPKGSIVSGIHTPAMRNFSINWNKLFDVTSKPNSFYSAAIRSMLGRLHLLCYPLSSERVHYCQ